MPRQPKPRWLDARSRFRVTPFRRFALPSTLLPSTLLPALLLGTWLLGTGLLRTEVRAETPTYRIVPDPQEGSLDSVQSLVQIEGTLKLNADGKRVHQLPFEVSARLNYAERMEAVRSGLRRTVRHYRLAAAEMSIAETPLRFELRQERQLVGALWGGVDRATLFCPRGPLTQEELDLIDVPGSSLCLDSLAPEEEVAAGQSWSPTPATLVALLNLDAIVRSDVQNTLLRVTDQTALVEIAGTLEGVVSGAATEIELKGQWEFDRRRERVRRLAVSLRENRAIGHCEPGFEVVTRIRTVIEPAESDEALSEDSLENLSLLPTAQNKLVHVDSPQSGLGCLHDRRWRVMADTPEGLVLRHVADGDLLAQCNITRLPRQSDAAPLSLAQFQEEVEQTLEERLEQFVEASETQHERLRILRVVATGTVSELPIRWIYYHVADAEGRRVSLVFTLEESVAERFGQADRPIVESIEMRDPRPAEPGQSGS